MTHLDALIANCIVEPSTYSPLSDCLVDEGKWEWKTVRDLVFAHPLANGFRLLAAEWYRQQGDTMYAELIHEQLATRKAEEREDMPLDRLPCKYCGFRQPCHVCDGTRDLLNAGRQLRRITWERGFPMVHCNYGSVWTMHAVSNSVPHTWDFEPRPTPWASAICKEYAAGLCLTDIEVWMHNGIPMWYDDNRLRSHVHLVPDAIMTIMEVELGIHSAKTSEDANIILALATALWARRNDATVQSTQHADVGTVDLAGAT